MGSIYTYLKDNSNVSFFEKKFNDVDAGILSLVSYIDLSIKSKDISLGECLKDFLEYGDLKEFLRHGFAQKNLIKLAKILKSHFRYRDIIVKDYIYRVNNREQFCAMTFILPTGEKIITFEGTDHELVGWKEDFAFSYNFPCDSEKDAIKYVSKNVNIFDKNVVIMGHSKGGHLALVSSMYSNFFIRSKIKKIYNFDGPGLLNNQINSRRYRNIEKKLIHYVPAYSIIGLLLRHNNKYNVVRTTRKDLFAHSIFNWVIEKDKFVKDSLSSLSKSLDKSIILWLDRYSLKEREQLITSIFDFLEKNGITNVLELRRLKTILMLYKERNKLSVETRNVITNFIKFNYDYHKNNNLDIELI